MILGWEDSTAPVTNSIETRLMESARANRWDFEPALAWSKLTVAPSRKELTRKLFAETSLAVLLWIEGWT
jgi:hypothetical protein